MFELFLTTRGLLLRTAGQIWNMSLRLRGTLYFQTLLKSPCLIYISLFVQQLLRRLYSKRPTGITKIRCLIARKSVLVLYVWHWKKPHVKKKEIK